MNTISLQKVSDNTLCSTNPYEQLFDHVAAHLQAQGGTLKTVERTQGRIEAAWKYGINPFGLRITAHFTAQGDETIQITLNGSFVDQGESMSVHFSLAAVIPATMTCSR